jgi:hypothetical protein
MDGIPSFLFFLHYVVLPEEMLEPTGVPFNPDPVCPPLINIIVKPALSPSGP